MLNLSHKAKRDLFTKMGSIHNTDGGLVVQLNYTYDMLGRPLTQQTLRSGGAIDETFNCNARSESPRGFGVGLDGSIVRRANRQWGACESTCGVRAPEAWEFLGPTPNFL